MLNPLEQDKIQILLNDEILLGVVWKALNFGIEASKPEATPSDSNELLGEKYRSYEFGKDIVLKAFKKLEMYKRAKDLPKNSSRAV